MRTRHRIKDDEIAAAVTVGTVLMVAIVVALMGVIGVFLFHLVTFPEEPPELDVAYTKVNDRWSIQVNSASEGVPLSEFRVVAQHNDGTIVSYDSDGDAAPDLLLAMGLEELAVSSGEGPQTYPMVYIDTDGDGKVGAGDSFVAYREFIPSVNPLMDGTRGYTRVGNDPYAIPKDSELVILANPMTMGSGDINPGDNISIEIEKGSTVYYTKSGKFSSQLSFRTSTQVEASWPEVGGYKATITVRPGEADEWSQFHIFKVVAEDPLTPEEQEFYRSLSEPLRMTDTVSIIHEPSNTVIIEFTL